MLILVTGATGLVGNNVVRQLLQAGHEVRALIRETSPREPLKDLALEVLVGELHDSKALAAACDGVDGVIHAAAMVHIGWTGLEALRKANVAGTQAIARQARQSGARFVHVSSVDALGLAPDGQLADEETPREGKIPCSYVVTKREAEDAVRKEIESGLAAAIVNPGFMLGPWDWKPSSGRMLLKTGPGFIPLAPRGGCSVCDVRDVAAGILAALERGEVGRNYIMAGHNLTYLELWTKFSRVAGGRPPIARMGPIVRWSAGLIGDAIGKVVGREQDANSAAIAISSQKHFYSSQRANLELGYQMNDVDQTIQDAWDWFVEHGYTTAKR